jgi:hypothetical protein
LRLLSIRDNPLIVFSLTGGSSFRALREVARVKRCQIFGDTDGAEVEVEAEAALSLEFEKDGLRKLDDARFGMGMGAGTERGKSLGTYGGGDDETKLKDWDSPYPVRACEPERRNSVFSFSRPRPWMLMDIESETGMIDAVSLTPRESSNLGCTKSRRASWWWSSDSKPRLSLLDAPPELSRFEPKGIDGADIFVSVELKSHDSIVE